MKLLKMLRILLLLLLFVVNLQQSHGQDNKVKPRLVNMGAGVSIIDEILPEEYAYSPFQLLGLFNLWQKGNLVIFSEIQLVHAVSSLQNMSEFEFGTNFGFRYRLPIAKVGHLTALIGTGPHFITVDTRRQSDGFIFSDNFELGIERYFKSLETQVVIKGRWRHISNAGLKNPNGGIDNLFLIIGLGKEF